jgi:uncharacterized repeat protein (TIGR01451 family)
MSHKLSKHGPSTGLKAPARVRRRARRAVGLALSAVLLLGPAGPASAKATGADLSVSLTDGVASVVPGTGVAYVVSVRDNGPATVSSLSLSLTLPTALRDVTFVLGAGKYQAGSHVWSGLNLSSGQTVLMAVVAGIDPAAAGALTTTVTVAPPAGVSDPVASNNTATDTDTLAPVADLSVAETDAQTAAVPGAPVSYTVTVKNAGPSAVGSVVLADSPSAALGGVSFSPAAGSYNSASHVWSALALGPGATTTMTVRGTVGPTATGTLVNTVTVAPPAGTTDPFSRNNTATDTDSLSPQADLAVTLSDGATTAVPGSTTTYTLTVTNNGPSTATGATLADALPAGAVSGSWAASNGTAGTGSLAQALTLAPGGSVTYTLSTNLNASATGSLQDTATVSAPAGLLDPNSANNSATDTDSLSPQADLSVTVDDGTTTAVPAGQTSYTVVVSNAGPSAAPGATLADALPAGADSGSWTATVSAGSSQAASSGSGGIATSLTLLPGGTATYTLVATIDAAATGTLTDSATVTAPSSVTDTNPANNTAADVDTLSAPSTRLMFGNLVLCNLPVLPGLDGLTVAQFLGLAEQALGGGASPGSVADVDTLTADLNAAFDGAPSAFALQDLSTSGSCQPVSWQRGDLTTYAQSDWANEALPESVAAYEIENSSDETLSVGVGNTLYFDEAGAVGAYLPASGPPGVLGSSELDPTQTSAGVFGGDVVALKLNVDFSGSYAPRACAPPGTTACPWGVGDIITYDASDWTSDATASRLLLSDFVPTYSSQAATLIVGSLSTDSMYFDSPDAVQAYLPTSGSPGALTGAVVDPTTTSAGVFGGDMVALHLDVDFGDAGFLDNTSGLNLGDLTVCDLPSVPTTGEPAALPELNGLSVRQVLAIADAALSGGPAIYTPAQLDPLIVGLTVSFEYGVPEGLASYLYDGACPGPDLPGNLNP